MNDNGIALEGENDSLAAAIEALTTVIVALTGARGLLQTAPVREKDFKLALTAVRDAAATASIILSRSSWRAREENHERVDPSAQTAGLGRKRSPSAATRLSKHAMFDDPVNGQRAPVRSDRLRHYDAPPR